MLWQYKVVSKLPKNQTEEICGLYVYNKDNPEENNVCMELQVMAAKAKGWTTYYTNDNCVTWSEYKGFDAEIDGIGSVNMDENNTAVIYTLSGVKLNTTNLSDLPSGIYVINGKKVKIK